MLDFRYISIISIFTASLLGSIIPKFINESFTPFIKMFSAGIIASLSLVHIVPDTVNDLAEISYPLGGTSILIGLLGMIIIESLSHSIFVKPEIKNHNHENDNNHNHTCIINLNSSNLVTIPQVTSPFLVYVFEFACIFHSFIIGLSLGLINDQDNVKKLMIALIFHQMIEGLSLGAMIISSKISKIKSSILIISYSFTTPIGILIGLFIGNNNDEENLPDSWVITRGVFLGISAGMLIYISLIQIAMEELSREELHINTRKALIKKISMHISMLLGAASMCVIALWI